jgi:hypothetical protein
MSEVRLLTKCQPPPFHLLQHIEQGLQNASLGQTYESTFHLCLTSVCFLGI